MQTQVAPQARMIAGLARADITPPVGMYHRMWGAAVHDQSTGIHRPLMATALWMQPCTGAGQATDATLLVALDHCILERREMDAVRQLAGHTTGLPAEQVHVCLSHTHGAGFMSRSRADLPGGDRIGPYLDAMVQHVAECAERAQVAATPAMLVYGRGRSSLAAHRDGFDSGSKQYVCGYHPGGPADDTLVVARLVATSGKRAGETLGTLVNYACHPTTLAWQNTLVSPDYVGALRETVEAATGGAPCLFLQGASGDLGPREGFVGDVAVADRNGRQLAYDTLAVCESLPPPGTRFVYTGPVVSGATVGTWAHQPLEVHQQSATEVWRRDNTTLALHYRPDLPTIEQTEQELARCQLAEEAARKGGNQSELSESRARTERMTRQLARLRLLPPGNAFPYQASVLRTGNVLWVIASGELYQALQIALRQRFPDQAIIVATIANDWQPGYLPTRETYGRGIYQEQIAVVSAGSLERLIEHFAAVLEKLTA